MNISDFLSFGEFGVYGETLLGGLLERGEAGEDLGVKL